MIRKKDAIKKIDKTLRFLKCFEECVEAFQTNAHLPREICYQRAKTYYKLNLNSTKSNMNNNLNDSNIYFFDSPLSDQESLSNMINNFEYLNSDHVVDRTNIDFLVSNGQMIINNLGKWILIIKIKVILKLRLC
jgi:hypothetical protein